MKLLQRLMRVALGVAVAVGLGGWALDVDRPVFDASDFSDIPGLEGVFVPVDETLQYDPISYVYRFVPLGDGLYEVGFIQGETGEETRLRAGAVPLTGRTFALQFAAERQVFPLAPSARSVGFTIVTFRCRSLEEFWLASVSPEAISARLDIARANGLNMAGPSTLAAGQGKEQVRAMLTALAGAPELFDYNDVYVSGDFGQAEGVSVSPEAAIGCADV